MKRKYENKFTIPLKEVKYFKETRGWKSVCNNRAIFRTQSSIYDEAFFQK